MVVSWVEGSEVYSPVPVAFLRDEPGTGATG
jgi:hypothetical protein